ncbi:MULTISPECIES: type IV-A pilus assembly ATPase PilB [Pseudomonas]|jgi:type IV pilus assembly protein PilB|uniref:Type IV-A pilus assembly ATPase PilB n=1 Tax=Pseudomonas abyssi TaxID=170540 RepID=A0A2A3MC35_9PSED|nr:type IV-A pilus assembly ATPase PilB [Pseudomonas abyssi]MAC99780.1 type IV-A pilus assembly ATPase PilB [Pseudomonadales bacterium]PBK02400.1 type IV-A pilus assembly ATPase PilB [Pseudomonas abyssi]|tara:strand:+ start:731 stop:2431 length:1701 start_codon:yes stop_codon:yes gene_type:complete
METPVLSGLARRIVQEGILSSEAASKASQQAAQDKIPFITHLVQRKLADAKSLAMVCADEFGYPYFDLAALEKEAQPSELVSEKLIRQHNVMPLFKRGSRLYLALSDPTNQQALSDIQFNTGLMTDAVIVEDDKLHNAIEKYLDNPTGGLGDITDNDLDELDVQAVKDDEKQEGGSDADDAPIVRFVNKMLLDAVRMGSSDLHFEPYEKVYRVRFRTDGVLHEVAKPPQQLGVRIAARLKVMSSMDLAERRKPQDGRIKLKISKNKAIDFRVNTLPTLWGEKVVLRILDSESAKMGIDALGYEDDQKQMYLAALSRPQGMILVTGPTGSGKTVSLYTGLNILNTSERNISTAEDPVEINLEGINQVNVNPKQGMDFAKALRAFLRQDPDIIMVGEIRDLETAEIAIKAAQTGHMVMSTLHTNSAAETLTRMRNMGVPSFNIATSVNLIIAQRLARRLCKSCKKPMEVPRETLIEEGFSTEKIDAGLTIYGPVGCENCKDGYKGRVGIYEVVRITPAMQRIIMEDGNSIQISDVAQSEGFRNLRQSALMKVEEGVTSLAEVNRVTKD